MHRAIHLRRQGFPAHAGMDPVSCSHYVTCSGLPRKRGDGPNPVPAHVASQEASPHTRGWTRRCPRSPHPQAGFPAHAGMDPCAATCHPPCTGLPRTRGDGPVGDERGDAFVSASPHTRGWTLRLLRGPDGGDGFPANAGMDPARSTPRPPGCRLPRTRGDGPGTYFDATAAVPASPHTRGWTLRRNLYNYTSSGFPAHAGMDPPPGPGSSDRTWLPRTRGDGPFSQFPARTTVAASPHTRGWTCVRRRGRGERGGFPAHAGMDLRRAHPSAERTGLPRTRGDGPDLHATDGAWTEASPHTRGWTEIPHPAKCRESGFPAHAGMDPCSPCPIASIARLPRTRGDGPSRTLSPRAVRTASPHTRGWTRRQPHRLRDGRGFPAHAGMDLGYAGERSRGSWLPRTRGDGPVRPPSSLWSRWASPHTRGWTLVGGSRCRPRLRLPRTRGDGPRLGLVTSGSISASPHTRGWTRQVRRVGVEEQGFPAHAGMDLVIA